MDEKLSFIIYIFGVFNNTPPNFGEAFHRRNYAIPDNQVVMRRVHFWTSQIYSSPSTRRAEIFLNTQNYGYLKKQKDLDDFFSNKSTLEYIDVIIKRENLKERNSVFIKSKRKLRNTN